METRASFIASMRDTQQLSPEQDPSPANGDGEQFDSGELPSTPTAPCPCCSSSQAELGAWEALGMVVQLQDFFFLVLWIGLCPVIDVK